MKVYFLGDLHISCDHQWSDEVILKFYEWFKTIQTNPKEDILIQLGDVFERASNYGGAIALVTKLFGRISQKFKKVFIIGGNHDLGLRNSKFYYATEYLERAFSNVSCIYKEAIIQADNISITLLPHQRVNGVHLDKYYSEMLEDKFYNSPITCGHVAIKEEGTFFGGMEISKFNTQFILGHIHTRNGNYKDSYTGSILPNKINENKTELQRCIKVFDTITKTFSEIPIPNIIEFNSVSFGDKIPESNDNITRLYTVKNCKNLNEARNYYSNYIYGVEKPVKNDAVISVSKENLLMTPAQALDLMIKEQKLVMKRKTHQLVKELI